MQTNDVARFPWNKVFERLNMDPTSPDKKKLFSYLEDNLGEWISKRSAMRASAGPVVDPAFAKDAPKVLHGLLHNSGNAIDLNTLCGIYAIKVEMATTEDSLSWLRGQIRLYCKMHPETFAVTGKGIAKVHRLKDLKGKATGQSVPDAGTSTSSGSGFTRFTKKVKALGFNSKAEFERAKKDLGSDSPTQGQLGKWLASKGS